MANSKDQSDQEHQHAHIQFNIDVQKTPTLYADSYLIVSNENAVTLNFAQAMPDPKQQNIVSRIAMSRVQAKEFVKTLEDHIAKYEV
jgi:hypothetical protein